MIEGILLKLQAIIIFAPLLRKKKFSRNCDGEAHYDIIFPDFNRLRLVWRLY
jgi:hypothetical protein